MQENSGNSELIKQLNSDFDEHLKNITEKNKNYKYGDVLTSENFEEVRTGRC